MIFIFSPRYPVQEPYDTDAAEREAILGRVSMDPYEMKTAPEQDTNTQVFPVTENVPTARPTTRSPSMAAPERASRGVSLYDPGPGKLLNACMYSHISAGLIRLSLDSFRTRRSSTHCQTPQEKLYSDTGKAIARRRSHSLSSSRGLSSCSTFERTGLCSPAGSSSTILKKTFTRISFILLRYVT